MPPPTDLSQIDQVLHPVTNVLTCLLCFLLLCTVQVASKDYYYSFFIIISFLSFIALPHVSFYVLHNLVGEKEWGGGEVREDAADEEEEWEEGALRSEHLEVKPIKRAIWNTQMSLEHKHYPQHQHQLCWDHYLSSESPQNDSETHTACLI